jgi:hypothetical protein
VLSIDGHIFIQGGLTLANVIQALLTNSGRAALAESFGGPTGGFLASYGKYFKIGTAMHTLVSGQEQPLPPQASFTDVQSVVSGVFYYQLHYQAADILFINPTTIQFRCFLDLLYANGNPGLEPDTSPGVDGPKNSTSLGGNSPIFFELGIFDPQDVLVAYGTFPGETKLNTKTLNHLVNINF